MTDVGEYTLELEPELLVCKLGEYVGVVDGELGSGDPGSATALMDNGGLQRARKLSLFPKRLVVASSQDRGSDVMESLDVNTLLAQLS